MCAAVCYPIPLHLLMRVLVHIYYYVRFPRLSWLEKSWGDAWSEGKRVGELKGYKQGWDAKERQLSAALDVYLQEKW